jgi:tight adherence protein B
MNSLVVACGLGLAVGAAGLAWSWWGDRVPGEADDSPETATKLHGDSRAHPRRGMPATLTARRRDLPLLVAPVVGGVVALVATGWPAALPIAAAATFGVPKLFGQTSGSAAITRVEAVATWTEMLQGTLTASAGLGQAIVATAPLAPLSIRPATTRLSARLTAGMHPREALLQFADELADPSADRVVCALLLAVSARAQRLGDVLTALADSTRDEVALRLRIETSRASVRSGVRTVLVFSVAFAVSLVVLAHAYLAPFGTAQGQILLVVVGVLYAVGLTLMVSLARPPAPVRLLGDQVVVQ